MSKMDDLRALREARYDRTMARAASAPRRAAPRKAQPSAPGTVEATPTAAEPEVQRCGHRNMSGRTCTREHGHAAKSHRYS
jgi:hypothetical protein